MNCPSCQMPVPDDVTRCPTCSWLLHPWLSRGTKLQGGKYTVGRVLGRGGFGITYLGANTLLGMPVALKELFPEGSGRGVTQQVISSQPQAFQEEKQRFLQEGRILARFNHPSIVRVMDVFEENNTCFLVMEYLRGQTLSARILQAGRLTEQEVLHTTEALLTALEGMHQAGLLHRDLKPENVFLTEDGRVVLIDFGTARLFEADKTSRHTRMVTPGYGPPEQYVSEARVGPYSDLYSLGATLYHMLVGEAPPEAMGRVMGASLKPLPLPDTSQLGQMVQRTLQILVQDRPQSVQEVRLLLKPAVPAQPLASPVQAAFPKSFKPKSWTETADEQFREAVNCAKYIALHHRIEPLLLSAARKGHLKAQLMLAEGYLKGKFMQRSEADAAAWFRAAAEQGDPGAQHKLGTLLAHHPAEALQWFTRAAQQNHPEAQFHLGEAYETGKGVPHNLNLAVEWYQKAADNGQVQAAQRLKELQRKQTGQQEEALFQQGLHSLQKNTPQGLQNALQQFLLAAERGHVGAQLQLGHMHDRGIGTPHNVLEATRWYRKAAENGLPEAQNRLADCYLTGRGVDRSSTLAAYWYRKAAMQGDMEGQKAYADLCLRGDGMAFNAVKAAQWYRRAADQGHVGAQYEIGRLFEVGSGVPRDLTMARRYYSAARLAGNAQAAAALSRLSGTSSP